MKKTKLLVNAKKDNSQITWENFSKELVIRISNRNIDVEIELDEKSARDLKQALSKVA